MSTEAIHTLISRLPLFSELPPDQVDHLSEHSREVHLARGEALFHVGEHPAGFYVVMSGQVKLCITSPSGAEKVMDLVGPGHSFGEALLFMDQPSPVTAQAVDATAVVLIRRQVLFDLIDDSPLFSRRMLAGLSRRLHFLVSDLESYCLESSAQRVIGFLLGEAQATGDADSPLQVVLPANKSLIASRLSLTPETFSRTLHYLTVEEFIQVHGKTITIQDPEGLRLHREAG